MKGEGDGQRNKIFADAFGQDPEFFAFYRAMQAYEKALIGGETSLILSPDSEFFKFFEILNQKKNNIINHERVDHSFWSFLFIEGLIYAIFPSKMKSILIKMKEINNNQLRFGGLLFAVLGFVIIWYFKKLMIKKFSTYFLLFYFIFNFEANSKDAPSSFADLAEKLMPSVVNISTSQAVVTKSNPFPGFEFPPGSPFGDMFKEFGTPEKRKAYALGSGFIIDEKGIVITNNHVIQGAEDILVRVNGNKEYEATIVGTDPLSDIAVLQIKSKDKFVPVKFGNSDEARIGDWVIAIGNPFGLGGTVTAGIISCQK